MRKSVESYLNNFYPERCAERLAIRLWISPEQCLYISEEFLFTNPTLKSVKEVISNAIRASQHQGVATEQPNKE